MSKLSIDAVRGMFDRARNSNEARKVYSAILRALDADLQDLTGVLSEMSSDSTVRTRVIIKAGTEPHITQKKLGAVTVAAFSIERKTISRAGAADAVVAAVFKKAAPAAPTRLKSVTRSAPTATVIKEGAIPTAGRSFKVDRTVSQPAAAGPRYIPPTAAEIKAITKHWSIVDRLADIIEFLEDVADAHLISEFGAEGRAIVASHSVLLKQHKKAVADALKFLQDYGRKRPPALATKIVEEANNQLRKELGTRVQAPETSVYVGLATVQNERHLAFFYYTNWPNFTYGATTYPKWYTLIVAAVTKKNEIIFKASATGDFERPNIVQLDDDQELHNAAQIAKELTAQFFLVHSMSVARRLKLPVTDKMAKKHAIARNPMIQSVTVNDMEELVVTIKKGTPAAQEAALQAATLAAKEMFKITTARKKFNMTPRKMPNGTIVVPFGLQGKAGADLMLNAKDARQLLNVEWGLTNAESDKIVADINKIRAKKAGGTL